MERVLANLWRHFSVFSTGRGVWGERRVKWSVNWVLGMWYECPSLLYIGQ